MKIGLDARLWSEEHAGLSRYIRELVYNLSKIDKYNQYFLFLPKQFLKINLPNNFQKIAADFPIYTISEQINFLRLINHFSLDLFHFTAFNHPIFYKKPMILTVHDLIIFLHPSKKRKNYFQRLVAKTILVSGLSKAKAVVVPSKATKKDLISFFGSEERKIKVIPHGVPKIFYPRPASEIEEFLRKKEISAPFLLYVGQWRPHKNLQKLILAYNLARQKAYFKMVLGGRPDYPPVLEEIKKSPYRKDIIVPGFVDDQELPFWYQSALAFIFPSLSEGFGYPVLEAAACGTPVLSSNLTSLPEVLGSAGFYFNPHNIPEIASAMVQIVEDGNLRKELSKKVIQQAQEFSFQKMAQQTLEVYRAAH